MSKAKTKAVPAVKETAPQFSISQLSDAGALALAVLRAGNTPTAVRRQAAALLKKLRAQEKERETYAACIAAAREGQADDECEIDDLPLVAPGAKGEGGVFVNAWLWVPKGAR